MEKKIRKPNKFNNVAKYPYFINNKYQILVSDQDKSNFYFVNILQYLENWA